MDWAELGAEFEREAEAAHVDALQEVVVVGRAAARFGVKTVALTAATTYACLCGAACRTDPSADDERLARWFDAHRLSCYRKRRKVSADVL